MSEKWEDRYNRVLPLVEAVENGMGVNQKYFGLNAQDLQFALSLLASRQTLRDCAQTGDRLRHIFK